tara:strand:- start:789 stop:1592 length:804 start_codon:yes stop_codon:yes gene_type:complete
MAIAENYNSTNLNIKAGELEVRLAENNVEIDAAQKLRYKVFYEEMSARPTENQKRLKRDIDMYDFYFDHILVIDNSILGTFQDKVVGTYRLNRGNYKTKKKFFYTANEFNIEKLLKSKHKILELGRSCVDEKYRNGKIMQMLWKFIAQYVNIFEINIMFGCASFPGTDTSVYKDTFSYLHNNYLAPESIRPVAIDERFINMNHSLDNQYTFKKFLGDIPPLIKGYIRLGAFIGEGAVIDHDFNTVDVCIVLPTKKVASRYMDHYDRK